MFDLETEWALWPTLEETYDLGLWFAIPTA